MYTINRPDLLSEKRLNKIDIYEYSDLALLLRDLKIKLSRCEEEQTLIKRKKKADLFPDWITFDIETTSVREHTAYNNTDQPFAFPYSYQFYAFGRCYIFREEWQAKHFFDTVAGFCKDHYLTICFYIHNASFEYEFLKSIIPIDTDDLFAVKARKMLRYHAYNGALEFRCSYMLSNMSLEKFTENYCSEKYRKDKELIDYEQLRFSWTGMSQAELYYSAMDVICLYKAIESIMDRERDNIKSIPMTNTGYVRRACRLATLGENTKHYLTPEQKATYAKCKRYRKAFEKTALNMEQYSLLLRAFRGGNTHANRFYAGQIVDNVGSVDFSSSYPAVICCSDDFPMGRLVDCTNDIQNNIDYYCSRYWVLIDAVFEDLELRDPYHTTCPYIPSAKCTLSHAQLRDGIFDNGRIISVPGLVNYCFLGIEWEIIKKQYKGRFMIRKAYYSLKSYLPNTLRNQCFDWFDKKTRLKNVAGSEYEYMKSKNRVNSIYGMMVEKIVKNIVEYSEEEDKLIERLPTPEEAEKQLSDFYTPMQQKFLSYQWGVTITAVARVRHMELIDLVGEDFIYGDTDSVKMLNYEKYLPEIEKYNDTWKRYIKQCGCNYESYTVKNEYQCLGIADFECVYDRFVTLGAKKYADEHNGKLEITIAGVPKKIGAQLLGSIENFRPGFKFEVSDDADNEQRQAWKKKLTYRDDTNFDLQVGDHTQHVGTGIAITRTTYDLDISDEYAALTGYFDMMIEEDPY